ncbi:hypothetical protein HK101_006603, partial [Irineochytrium annulatum]
TSRDTLTRPWEESWRGRAMRRSRRKLAYLLTRCFSLAITSRKSKRPNLRATRPRSSPAPATPPSSHPPPPARLASPSFSCPSTARTSPCLLSPRSTRCLKGSTSSVHPHRS